MRPIGASKVGETAPGARKMGEPVGGSSGAGTGVTAGAALTDNRIVLGAGSFGVKESTWTLAAEVLTGPAGGSAWFPDASDLDKSIDGGSAAEIFINIADAKVFSVTSGRSRVFRPALATTRAAALQLINETASTALADQQNSPALEFHGTGWDTAAAASQSVVFGVDLVTSEGATAPSGVLSFFRSINGGPIGVVFSVSTVGAMTGDSLVVTNTLQAGTTVELGGGAGQTVTNVLTDAATIAVDADLGQYHEVTLGGNRTLALPTTSFDATTITIKITQDGTGSRTLAYATGWQFEGGTAPTLSTTAADVDILTAVTFDGGTTWQGVLTADWS